MQNLTNWAKKYNLEDELKILTTHGFDDLNSVAHITEDDLDKMGITKLGNKKKNYECHYRIGC